MSRYLKKPIIKQKRIRRPCLKCGKVFTAQSKFNRLCLRCKRENAMMAGVLRAKWSLT